jgi:predicted small secreted protein
MMKKLILITVTCLVVTACGPAEGEKQTGKDFMSKLGECPKCGQTKINVFGEGK